MIDHRDISKRLFEFVGEDPYDPEIDWAGADVYLEDEMYDIHVDYIDAGYLIANHFVITSPNRDWEYIATVETYRTYERDDRRDRYYGKVKGNAEEFEAWLVLMKFTLNF